MPKWFKNSFLFLGIMILLMVIMLYAKSKQVVIRGDFKQAKVDMVKLEKEYKGEVRIINQDIGAMIDAGKIEQEKVDLYKDKLLALKVPKEYKDLHIQFIFVLEKLDSFLATGNQAEKLASRKIISDLDQTYAWLND
jgi:hypothetical protein